MKTVQFSVRLNKSDHEKIKHFARRNGFGISQILRDMINGKYCLCEDHAIQHLLNSPANTPHGWEDFLYEYKEQIPLLLKLSFENLMLQRLAVQKQSPELIEQARQQRIKRFGLTEKDNPEVA